MNLQYPDEHAGIEELMEELDRNPKGENSPLMKAEAGSYTVSSKREDIMRNICRGKVPMGKDTWGRPLADYIVIRQDRYRDEMQCRKCSGRGHGVIPCRNCNGTAALASPGRHKGEIIYANCKECVSSDFDSPALPKSTGFLPCSECNGTGQATAKVTGLVTATDTASEPSTGVVVAIGRSVTEFRVGDRILYSQFAGIGYECEGAKWRVMKQTYPIMIIEGTGDVRAKEGV